MTEHRPSDTHPDQGSQEPAEAQAPPEHEAQAAPDSGVQPDAAAAGQADERSASELLVALADAERTAEEYLDHLRRERAEFENFRRRSNKERMEALDRGAEQLVSNLLGVLDNFGYVLDAAASSQDEQLAKGVEMAHTELVKVLREAGLEEVPGAGEPFDPTWHEAVAQVEVDDPGSEGQVVEVLRPGYRFKGRLLRPASVAVAQGAPGAQGPEQEA